MTQTVRLTIALLITAVFLAAICATAILSHPPMSAPATAAPVGSNVAIYHAALPTPPTDEQVSND
jgi:hypothetical protein